MTKQIRIENADTSTYVVVVEVQEKNADGEFKTIRKVKLPFATAMITETIWQGKRLIVREFDNELDKDIAL